MCKTHIVGYTCSYQVAWLFGTRRSPALPTRPAHHKTCSSSKFTGILAICPGAKGEVAGCSAARLLGWLLATLLPAVEVKKTWPVGGKIIMRRMNKVVLSTSIIGWAECKRQKLTLLGCWTNVRSVTSGSGTNPLSKRNDIFHGRSSTWFAAWNGRTTCFTYQRINGWVSVPLLTSSLEEVKL